MGKKDQKDDDRVEAVVELLRKQAPLTVKQVSGFSFLVFFCVENMGISVLKLLVTV